MQLKSLLPFALKIQFMVSGWGSSGKQPFLCWYNSQQLFSLASWCG